VLERVGLHRGPWMQPWVEPVLRDHPELAERASTFWGDREQGEWSELIILADRAGVVFERDPAQTWERLEHAAAAGIVVPPLPAEEPHVRPLLQKRLDLLSGSAELRQRYFAVVRDTWQVLKPYWESSGRAAAEALVQHVRTQLNRGVNVRTLLPPSHFARREDCSDIVDDATEHGELVVVPLGLAGIGIAFFALPGLVIAAFGPEAEKKTAMRRERAERAASHFKLVSDPTRVAILSSLLCSPNSITDLAEAFDLSQPTVSVHVKMLREAGLLDSEKRKGHTLYTAPAERVRALLGEATDALMEDSSDCST
jgi:DNA-binding transcriptional ArsR family regulator